jgi:hypothetical protein
MTEVLTTGFYVSEGKYHEDTRPGNVSGDMFYSYLKLDSDETFIEIISNNANLDFIDFLKNLKVSEKQGYPHGTYSVIENQIQFVSTVESLNKKVEYHYTILSPLRLLDSSLREYRFRRG